MMVAAARVSPSGPARRGFIMIAVLVVMLSAILVATSLLFVAQSEAAGATGAGDAAQTRALIWSGAQAVMSRLADQRQRILEGEMPRVAPQIVIYETESRAGVARLLPIGPGGEVVVPEAGKLDINRVDAEGLARTGLVDRALATDIIAWRERRGLPVQSVNDLLEIPGITAQTLYGSIEQMLAACDASAAVDRRLLTGQAGTAARGFADVLTVHSVEPNVQSSGRLRISLNASWNEELARRVEERFGAEAVDLLRQIFESGAKFTSDADLVKAMRAYGTPPESWPAVLDGFTAVNAEVLLGRVDINAAPREALLGLPELTADQADQIVSLREELSPHERATVTWPVGSGIVTPESFERIVERITTRCWTFRIRLAAGETALDSVDGPIDSPQIHDLVIDMSDATPRIAYWRDVSLLRDASLMAFEAMQRDPGLLEPSVVAPPSTMRSNDRENAGEAAERRAAESRPDSNSRSNGRETAEPIADVAPGRLGRWRRGD